MKALEAKVARQAREEKATKAQAQNATNIANAANAAVVKGPGPAPGYSSAVVGFKNGLTVETLDHKFYFKVGGRNFVDGGLNSEPIESFPITGWPSLAKPWSYYFPPYGALGYGNNVTFPQARLEVEGKAWSNWFYKFQIDFAGSPNDLALGMFRDAWLAYRWNTGVLPLTFQVGNQLEASGLERENSSKTRDFLKRAFAIHLLAGNRHVGLAVATGAERIGLLGKLTWTWKGGICSTSFEDGNPASSATATALTAAALAAGPALTTSSASFLSNFGIPAGNSGFLKPVAGGHQYWDLASRVMYAPIHTSDALLHLGGSVRYQKPNDAAAATDDRVLQPGATLCSESNSSLGDNLLLTQPLSCASPLLQTVGGNCVKSMVNLAAEAVAAYGPASVRAEYSAYHYDRDAGKIAWYNAAANAGLTSGGVTTPLVPGGASVNFRGFYVYGAYYLTGESRADSYLDPTEEFNAPGTFGQTKIKHPLSQGGWGAWEVAARYSTINLNDGHALDFQPPTVSGAGFINNQHIKGGRESDVTLGLNWYPEKGLRVMANSVNTVQYSANCAHPERNGIHPQSFVMRAQVDW